MRVANWEAPSHGLLMFNVDGFVLVKPGHGGIGGVLHNDDVVMLLVVFKSIGIIDSNVVEFLTIKKAFTIFVGSKWGSCYGLIIESDNVNAVKFINNLQTISWRLKKFSAFIESLKEARIEWRIQLIHKEINEIVDALVKAGVNRTNNLLIVLN
ncbi:hypothetical protein REPUB_Repub09cG0063900 [Reevesia pubescens]